MSPYVVWRQVVVAGHNEGIRRHVVAPTLFREGDPVALELEFGMYSLTVTPAYDGEYHAVSPGKSVCQRITRACTLKLEDLSRSWHVHCGPLDRPHRLLSFRYLPANPT